MAGVDNAISNAFVLKHPKPLYDFERKLVAGIWQDWDSTAEVNASVPIAYRKNKHFWIAGYYTHCDNDGTTYRTVGGGTGISALKFAINADGTGTPDDTFDGYKAEGVSISDSRLENVLIIATIVGSGGILQDFYVAAPNRVVYSSVPGEGILNFSQTLSGRLYAPDTVIVLFKQL